jgi:hypothetical protein
MPPPSHATYPPQCSASSLGAPLLLLGGRLPAGPVLGPCAAARAHPSHGLPNHVATPRTSQPRATGPPEPRALAHSWTLVLGLLSLGFLCRRLRAQGSTPHSRTLVPKSKPFLDPSAGRRQFCAPRDNEQQQHMMMMCSARPCAIVTPAAPSLLAMLAAPSGSRNPASASASPASFIVLPLHLPKALGSRP